MPARTPDVLAYRVFLALLAAAAIFALAARASVSAVPAPSPFRYWDPTDTSTVPRTLSAMGLYQAGPGKDAKLVPQARYYDVNSPLWSDDAKKKRWVVLKPGRAIGFKEQDDYWAYPDSAVFVKEFAIDTVPGDPKSRVLWETRVLINRKEAIDEKGTLSDRWYGYSYQWRKDQKDADLVDMTRGKDDSIRVWPDGKGTGKVPYVKKWHFPSIYQCEQCHRVNASETESGHGRSVLGFFTAQLNREAPDSAAINQLDWLFLKGVLDGKRPFAWEYSPRWHGIDDSAASIDMRARSYIAANCSGCHGRRGMEVGATMGVDLNYDFHQMAPQMEFRYRAVSWPFGLDTLPPYFYPKNDRNNPQHLDSLPIDPALVIPGYPDKSVIVFRQKERDTVPGNYDVVRNQMPPLGTYEVNKSAVALLEKWIRDMPAPVPLAMAAALRHSGPMGVTLRGGLLIVDPGFAAGNTEVTLFSVDGRRVPLRRVAGGAYALPKGLPKGLYFVRAGARSALKYLF